MNNPQFWGALRGAIIAIGGGLIATGVLKMTTEQFNLLINQATAVVAAIGGFVAVAWPMYQGWKSRSRTAIITSAAEQSGVQKIVTDAPTAAAIPSAKVVPLGSSTG